MLIAFNVNIDVYCMLNNKPIVQVNSAVHLGHKMCKYFNVKNVSHGVSSSPVKAELFRTYCTSYQGCVLWSLMHPPPSMIHHEWYQIVQWTLRNDLSDVVTF